MSSRRTLILIGAVVIGGLAAFLTLSYVRGVENRSDEANQMVKVVVATGPVAKGTSADQAIASEQLTLDERRRQDLPTNAVTRFADIEGMVAALDLSGGEVVTTSMFISPTDVNGSNAANMEKGMVAVTISVEEAAGVAGLVRPGDRVNVLARVCMAGGDCTAQKGGTMPTAGDGEIIITQPATYAFQNVKVLAVGQSLGQSVAASAPSNDPAATTTTAPTMSPLVTLELKPADAAILVSLRDADLYLTLNRPDYEPIPVPFTPVLPALPGELGGQSTATPEGQ